MNIIDGPGPSSVAIRVMGTGLEENFGAEAWREREGRADWTDDGRFAASFASLIEEGLLLVPSDDVGRFEIEEALDAFIEVERLDIEAGILVGLEGRSRDATEDVRFELGPDIEADFWPGVSDCPEDVGGGEKGLRIAGSGTFTSFSQVDFFDGRGPLIESPWLFLLRISFHLLEESLSDSKLSMSASLAALSGSSLLSSPSSDMTASESLSFDSLLESSLALA